MAAMVLSPAVAGAGSTPQESQAAGPPIGGVSQHPVEPLRIELEVSVRPELPRLRVDAALTFRARQRVKEVRFQLRPEIDLDLISDNDGVPLPYERDRFSVAIFSSPLAADSITTWNFRYYLRLSVPLQELQNFFTQDPWYPHLRYPRAADEFPRWVPTRARIAVRLPAPWVAVSAGQMAVTQSGDERRYVWTQVQPSPLHPLVIGKFRLVEHRSAEIVARGFFSPANAEQARTFVEYSSNVLEYYAEVFGSVDLKHYSLAELPLPAGLRGLTLPGLTVVPSRDVDPESPFPYRILAHEIAHNWWNFVLDFPKHSDYWLREGLPTYSALMFLERHYGPAIMRQELRRTRRLALTPELPQPLSVGFRMESPEALYALNYHKGAFVLHMLQTLLGRSNFVDFLREFHAAHSGGSVSVRDLRRAAEAEYGDDLDWFFSAWVDEVAVPRFRVRYSTRPQGSSQVPAYLLTGTVMQEDARFEGPALLRVRLQGAPPLEHMLWLKPGSTEFSITCPTPPEDLEFDPSQDLLYGSITVERISGAP